YSRLYRALTRLNVATPIRPVARRSSDAGSETDSALREKPRLPKSLRPVPKSPPDVQSFEMVLVSIVTAAFNAMARPHRIFAVVFRVMLWSARMLPANVVLVPRVAELPTWKYTPSVALPFSTVIFEELAVVSVLSI